MKVWINKRIGSYSGGMIMAAANSAEEAHEVFHNDSDYSYMYHRFDDGTYDDYNYKLENWKEVSRVIYTGDKPCIIDENGYTE